MKVEPFFVGYSDTWILGPAASIDTREFRIGFGLIFCEVGLCFISEKPFGYGCSGCGAIGEGTPDQLPPGWEKRDRPDHTFFFLCPNCQKGEYEEEDYVITEENREHALDEIFGQLMGEPADEVETKVIRDYANKLLDESEGWGKKELAASLAAYSDGFSDARKYKQ